MVKKLVPLFLFVISFSAVTHAQRSMQGLIVDMEHYRSYSPYTRSVLNAFSDTCMALYGCADIRKLHFSQTNLDDSIFNMKIGSEQLLWEGQLEERVHKWGEVVVMVDSVHILVRKTALFASCLGDSIEYVGVKPFTLKYESFESCLNQYGVVPNMKFTCSMGGEPKIYHFGAYITQNGQKKLDKYWKKVKKAERKNKK